jgi:hypothetical protein
MRTLTFAVAIAIATAAHADEPWWDQSTVSGAHDITALIRELLDENQLKSVCELLLTMHTELELPTAATMEVYGACVEAERTKALRHSARKLIGDHAGPEIIDAALDC